jgi:hypothetical protein
MRGLIIRNNVTFQPATSENTAGHDAVGAALGDAVESGQGVRSAHYRDKRSS